MKTIRNIVFSGLVGALLVVSLAGVSVVNAQTSDAAGNGIKVSPVRSELTINPGESKTLTLSVQNITGTTAEFQAIINDFVVNGELGQPALILDADKYAPSHSLKRYISEISNTNIEAGKSKDVKVVITMPKDAAAGGYYGAVRFTPAGSSTDKNVTLSASVGSLILVKVPGDLKEDMTISSFDVRKGEDGVGGSSFFTSNKKLYAVVRFKNSGNVHEQPFGKIRLLKGGKVLQQTEINNTDPRGNVLPDSIRRFNTELTKVGSFGKYTVEGNFGYGTNGQLLSANSSFWVVPLGLIVGVLVAIILIVLAVIAIPKAVKRYNRNVLRKAGRR